MRRSQRIAVALAAIAGVAQFPGCGSHSQTRWHNLTGVTVTVSAPGLPPPYGAPETTRFTTSTELARATTALNANHIAKQARPSPKPGCAGGYDVTISITERSAAPVQLFAYRCAHTTSGDLGGNVDRFLGALGIATP